MKTYKIPKRYYTDHVECGCEAPKILNEIKSHFIISAEETSELAELRNRAVLYAEDVGGDYWKNGYSGIVTSAKATIKIIGEV